MSYGWNVAHVYAPSIDPEDMARCRHCGLEEEASLHSPDVRDKHSFAAHIARSDLLLLLIEERCDPDGRYWAVPPLWETQPIHRLAHYPVIIGGAGDMRAITALIRRGQIVEIRSGGVSMGYRITDDGKLRCQELI